MARGLYSTRGVSAPPFSSGPFRWDQHVTFLAGVSGVNTSGDVYYVDGTNGASGNDGSSWEEAVNTIQGGIDLCGVKDTVFVAAKEMVAGDTDPSSYAETVIIGADNANTALVGVSRGRTQGGLPQIKKGSGSTALLTIRAPGCLVTGLGFNGVDSTGGGILLDDDGSTKTAFGTTIAGCHLKNCVGSTATNAATGGAIMWAATGGAWQVLIAGNKFYKNVGDIVLKGTSASVPQDVVIEDNVFSGPAANVDCNLYLTGGSGMNGVYIINNVFPCWPALSSGTNVMPIRAGGCIGILAGNQFGCPTQGAGRKTFGAAGDSRIPTTLIMSGNFGEADTEGDTGYLART